MLLFWFTCSHVLLYFQENKEKIYSVSDRDDNVEGPSCTADVLHQHSCELQNIQRCDLPPKEQCKLGFQGDRKIRCEEEVLCKRNRKHYTDL